MNGWMDLNPLFVTTQDAAHLLSDLAGFLISIFAIVSHIDAHGTSSFSTQLNNSNQNSSGFPVENQLLDIHSVFIEQRFWVLC